MEILNVQKLYPIIKGRSYKLRVKSQIKNIIFHHSGSSKLPLASLYKLHTDELHKWATIGYHFYITKAGNIYQVNDILTVVNGCTNMNTNSLHICLEGDYSKDIVLNHQIHCIDFVLNHIKSLKLNLNLSWHSNHKNTLCPGVNLIKVIKTFIDKNNKQQFMIWPELE